MNIKRIDGIYLQVKIVLAKPENKKRMAWGSLIVLILGIGIYLGLIFSFPHQAKAATYTCTASVSGNWLTPGTWGGTCEGSGTAYPGWTASNLDTVIINAGIVVTVTANVPNPVAAITLSNSNSVTTLALGAYTLSSQTVTITGGSGKVGSVTLSTGTLSVTGDITFAGTTGNAQLVYTSTGTVNLTGNFGSGSIAGVLTTVTGSIMNFKGTSTQTSRGYTTFKTLKVNNAAGLTMTGTSTIVTLTIGDVTANSVFADGGFQVTDTGTLNLTSGKFILGAAAATTWPAFATRNITAGTTVEYASAVAQTVSTTPTNYPNVTFSDAGQKNVASGTLAVAGTFSTTGGLAAFSTNNALATVTGDITSTGSITTGTGLITLNGSWLNTGTLTCGTGGVTFANAGGGGKQITGPNGGMTFTTLTINETVTNNNAGTVTISTALAGTSTLTQGSNSTLAINFTGAPTITGLNASSNTNTVSYGFAGAQTCIATTYYNLTLQSSGAKTCAPTGSPGVTQMMTVGGTETWTQTANVTLNNLTISGGTLTTAAYVFAVNGTTTISSGTLALADSTATKTKTLTGLLTLNGGTLNGVSTLVNLGAGIANNTGTVSLTGRATIPTAGATFSGANAIAITTLTVTSPGTVTNSGTVTISTALSGNGSFINGNGSTGTLNINFTGSVGITTLTATASSNTVNYGFAGTQNVFGTNYYNLTLSNTSAKTMTNVTTITGDLTISGSATMTSNAAFTLMGALNYSSSGNTTLAAAIDISIGNLNQTAGTITDNGRTITVTGTGTSWIETGTFTTTGTVNFSGSGTQTLNSGGVGAGKIFNNLTHSGAGTLQLTTNAINIDGVFTNSNGTFDGNDLNMNVADDFLVSGGSFSADVSPGATTQTVTFDGTNEATVSGSSTFNNLVMNTTTDGAKTIKFTAATTQTINGTWDLAGALGEVLTLNRSSGSGSDTWLFNIGAPKNSGDYINVTNSGTANANQITAQSNDFDGGNNPGWIFITNLPPDTPSSLGPAGYIDAAGWMNDNTPTFNFDITDPDPAEQVKYRIQIDDTAGFGSVVLDYQPSSYGAEGTYNYLVGQAGSYAVGSQSMTLSDSAVGGGYYWRVKAIDDDLAESAYEEAGVDSTIDFRLDATAPTTLSVYDGTDVGIDQDYSGTALNSLAANWTAANFNVSGPATPNKYQYAIGTTVGGVEILTWTSTNTDGAVVTANGLTVNTAIMYFWTVKATDLAGNITTVSSNGQIIEPSISFSFDTPTVTFTNLGTPAWTDTKETKITTQTNAKNGYSVQAYVLQLLTQLAPPNDTIDGWSGTYATPASWAGNCVANSQCGFGYTSSDPDITTDSRGNMYNSGANYCAYSQSSPGDVVADNNGPTINGSRGLIDQVFTLTHKVSVNQNQTAGQYQTTLMLMVTANY